MLQHRKDTEHIVHGCIRKRLHANYVTVVFFSPLPSLRVVSKVSAVAKNEGSKQGPEVDYEAQPYGGHLHPD